MALGVENELVQLLDSVLLLHPERVRLLQKMLVFFFRLKLEIVQLKSFLELTISMFSSMIATTVTVTVPDVG